MSLNAFRLMTFFLLLTLLTSLGCRSTNRRNEPSRVHVPPASCPSCG